MENERKQWDVSKKSEPQVWSWISKTIQEVNAKKFHHRIDIVNLIQHKIDFKPPFTVIRFSRQLKG